MSQSKDTMNTNCTNWLNTRIFIHFMRNDVMCPCVCVSVSVADHFLNQRLTAHTYTNVWCTKTETINRVIYRVNISLRQALVQTTSWLLQFSCVLQKKRGKKLDTQVLENGLRILVVYILEQMFKNMRQVMLHLSGKILSIFIIRGKKLTSCLNHLFVTMMFWSNVCHNLRIRFSDAGAPLDVMGKCWSNSTMNLFVKMMRFLNKGM